MEGAARVYGDGSVDVDVRLDPSAVVERVLALAKATRGEGVRGVSAAAIREAGERWPILWATGRAHVSERASLGEKSAGWEEISTEGIELAKRAAAADAIAALLDEAGQLKISNVHRLRDFLDADDAIRAAARAALDSAADVSIELAPDQVAVAQARLPMPRLIRVLSDVHQAVYRGDRFDAADFREMALLSQRTELQATGLAVPPEHTRLRVPFRLIELDRPGWADQTREVVGAYEPADALPAGRVLRRVLAKLMGVYDLRAEVMALVLPGGGTVADLLEYRPELKAEVLVFLSGARVISRIEETAEGGTTVRLSLPLERLWLIVQRGMRRLEVDPPVAAEAGAVESMEREDE